MIKQKYKLLIKLGIKKSKYKENRIQFLNNFYPSFLFESFIKIIIVIILFK